MFFPPSADLIDFLVAVVPFHSFPLRLPDHDHLKVTDSKESWEREENSKSHPVIATCGHSSQCSVEVTWSPFNSRLE